MMMIVGSEGGERAGEMSSEGLKERGVGVWKKERVKERLAPKHPIQIQLERQREPIVVANVKFN